MAVIIVVALGVWLMFKFMSWRSLPTHETVAQYHCRMQDKKFEAEEKKEADRRYFIARHGYEQGMAYWTARYPS